MKRLCILFGTLFLFTMARPQSRIDSFEVKISLLKEDSIKVTDLINYAKAIRGKNLIEQDSAKIIHLLQQALLLSEKLSYTKGTASAHIGLGNYYGYYLHQYPLALEHYKKTLAILKNTNNYELIRAKANENIAYIYQTIAAFPEAISYGNEAISIYKQLNETEAESRIYNLLGNIYSHLKQPDNAIANSRKAISLAGTINDNNLVSFYLNNLSANYISLYEDRKYPPYLDSALNYLNAAFSIAENSKDNSENELPLSDITKNLGNVYKLQNKLELAKQWLEKCIHLPDSLQNEYALCYAHGYLGESYFLENQFELSEKNLQIALQLAQKINAHNYLSFVYNLFYKLYDKKKDYATALLYHTKYMASKDSIYDSEKTAAVNNLNIKYETSQKEIRIQNLETDNKYRKNINRFLTALSLIAAALLGTVYYLYKLRRKTFHQKEQIFKQEKLLEEKQRQLLEDEINFKSRELTTNILHLEKKNELLITIKAHLQKLPSADKNDTTELKNIYKLIDSAVQIDDDFSKFSAQFENVHPQFFEQLHQKANGPLTQHDLKLCAFTKMRLSTKEIANLLNVEPASIRTARYRLKQKFNGIEEVDFSDFLIKL
jgi:tetratricopeptide (TPR) repeat protein/DNA-binding CsgD family transcriptional regulator